MKQIFVDRDNSSNSRPFWMPWGIGGVIWRYLVFLMALVLYLLLLWWLAGAHSGSYNGDVFDYEIPEDDPFIREYINGDYNDPLEDHRYIDNPSEELPTPEDNRIYDVPEEEIIRNPENEYKQIVSTRLNIILNSDATDATFNTFADHFKQLYPSDAYKINYYNALTKMMQITVPADERVSIKNNLPSQIPEVDFKIFYEEIFESMGSPAQYNDPAFSNQAQSWEFAPIQAFDAWDITKGSNDVIVAVIDSYIDVTHPELTGRSVKPYSVDSQDGNVLPPSGITYSFDNAESTGIYHGTHVAALAVGALNNGEGAAGIAPGCSLMPISVGEQITSMKLLDAVLYSIYQGADVVNISIASYFPEGTDETSLQEQVDYIRSECREQEDVWNYVFDLANERNCMIVWAAGNCNVLSGLDETKRNATTLRVSAVGPDIDKAEYSNYGKYDNYGLNFSDVSAPGTGIYSAGPGNAYGMCSGTSMAAPIVAGAVALMKSVNSELTNAQIIDILKRTGKPMPEDQHIGNLIQIRDALVAAGGSGLPENSGEVADFDEIQEDPNEIIGVWETTEQRTVTIDDTPTGEMCHVFLRFTSPTSGTISFREDDGDVYSAPFTARFTDNQIFIDQQGEATSNTQNDSYLESHLVCERGRDGRLEAYNRRTPNERFYFIRRH